MIWMIIKSISLQFHEKMSFFTDISHLLAPKSKHSGFGWIFPFAGVIRLYWNAILSQIWRDPKILTCAYIALHAK